MIAVLTILACFAGMFAFGFGLSGLTGLLTIDPQKKKEQEPPKRAGRTSLWLLAALVSEGTLPIIASNWSSRPTDRRLFCTGLAFGMASLALVLVLNWMS